MATQAKYEAATKGRGIEWRRIRSDGDLCASNVTINSNADFARPDGLDSDCEWFPIDTKLPDIQIDYTSVSMYISTFALFCSALTLIVLGPIGDFGTSRKSALSFCVVMWVVCFTVPILLPDPKLYLVTGALVFVGATCWTFGNRALRNAYLPLLVRANPEMQERVKQVESIGRQNDDPQATRRARLDLNTFSESLASQYSLETSAGTSTENPVHHLVLDQSIGDW